MPQARSAPQRADSRPIDVPGRLREIARQFSADLRPRVERLLLAAAEAILHLTDLDLVRYEHGEEGGSHGVAVWEELAPVMGETVESVNRMIDTAQEAFPAPPEPEGDDDLDAAFGPGGGEEKPEAPRTEEQEIAALVSAVCSGLRRDVARLGERLRTPSVVADPWNLVSDLLEFRGRLRAGIGELIFQVANRVVEATRSEVIPGYTADLESALLVRHASTNLAFLFRGHQRRIAAAPEDKLLAALSDALKDLGQFARTRALPALRTADKRIFLETRERLFALRAAQPLPAAEIRHEVDNLARFLDSLSVISRRENLRLYDRALLAAAGRALEQAQAALPDAGQARTLLARAVRSAAELYGRDPHLDAYLRAQRHFRADWLADVEIQGELKRLGALFADVPAP